MKAIRVLAATCLLLLGGTFMAHAAQYPPGPGNAFPDTLIKVSFIQDPAATPHPVSPDTVWGIGGIITGFDTFPSGFAVYIQNRGAAGALPFSGIDVFTGGTNYISLYTPPLALGDSIFCYGRMDEFQGETELRGLASSAFNVPLPAIRRISTGNTLPPFKVLTVNQAQELPTNLGAEQWEGVLVRVRRKLRVCATDATNPNLGTFSSFVAVDQSLCTGPGPCDTLFIDGSTLANPALSPPPVGALVDSVQGIYNQRTRGYRIQLRDANDLFDSQPPSLTDAYAISSDSVRLVFDRNLTPASANNRFNYTVGSTLGPPTAAVHQPAKPNTVDLRVVSGVGTCGSEDITANGVVNAQNGQPMTIAETQNFRYGLCPIATIQAPDPAGFSLVPCEDRSVYAGAGAALGPRITTQGVCTISFGSTYWIQTAAGGLRSGVVVFAPSTALVVGRQYTIAGAIQEFFQETELTNTVYIHDDGATPAPPVQTQTIAVLRDTTCDTGQSILNGEDFEGCLVRVVDARVVDDRTAGQSFFVADKNPANHDTILVDNNVTRTYDPVQNGYVNVTGMLDLSFGTWRIQPRNNADIVPGPSAALGVNPDQELPAGVSLTVAFNPGRTARVTFALPKREHVQLAVYDLAGRRRAMLADGDYGAGTHPVDWNGRDGNGSPVGSGVFFYRLKIGKETYERSGILIN